MAPPKKSTSATLDQTSANNFFQRGKKPTTTQRVITAKKAVQPAPTSIKKVSQEDEVDEVEDWDENDYDQDDEDEEEEEAEQQQSGVELEDEEDADEILSDDSLDIPAVTAIAKKVERATLKNKDPAAVVIPSQSSSGTKSRKKQATTTHVVPDIGDIHVGFHQGDLSATEKMLRQFDLASKYGPCTDITRLERWERANQLGLNPPAQVKDTLLKHSTMNTPLFEGRV